MAVPFHRNVLIHDVIRGEVRFDSDTVDDQVLVKSDGFPTYHLANVVDDHLMQISHVIRGDDHVNNTPRQINIYRALDAALPQFGHLPMILGPDGQKLSKRHGAVSVMQYDADGFLPEALFNYLARLGWSHGDAEKFTRGQLVEWFDLDHVNRAPAQYNLDKLLWLNGEYIKEADVGRLAALAAPRIEARGGTLKGGPALEAVIALLKDRSRTLNELADGALLFYRAPVRNEAAIAEHLTPAGRAVVAAFRERAGSVAWERAALNGLVKQIVAEMKVKMP